MISKNPQTTGAEAPDATEAPGKCGREDCYQAAMSGERFCSVLHRRQWELVYGYTPDPEDSPQAPCALKDCPKPSRRGSRFCSTEHNLEDADIPVVYEPLAEDGAATIEQHTASPETRAAFVGYLRDMADAVANGSLPFGDFDEARLQFNLHVRDFTSREAALAAVEMLAAQLGVEVLHSEDRHQLIRTWGPREGANAQYTAILWEDRPDGVVQTGGAA